jgi:hypothetical protein
MKLRKILLLLAFRKATPEQARELAELAGVFAAQAAGVNPFI